MIKQGIIFVGQSNRDNLSICRFSNFRIVDDSVSWNNPNAFFEFASFFRNIINVPFGPSDDYIMLCDIDTSKLGLDRIVTIYEDSKLVGNELSVENIETFSRQYRDHLSGGYYAPLMCTGDKLRNDPNDDNALTSTNNSGGIFSSTGYNSNRNKSIYKNFLKPNLRGKINSNSNSMDTNSNVLLIGGALLLGFMFFKGDKDKPEEIEIIDVIDESDTDDLIDDMKGIIEDSLIEDALIDDALIEELESIDSESCGCTD